MSASRTWSGAAAGVWILLLACLGLAAPARAEPRLALVIGNGAYPGAAALDNPVRDARAIAAVLGEARFQVTAVEDADRARLTEAVESFGRAVQAAGPEAVALVYYAGHAAQIDGFNYLLPVDVSPTGSETVTAASLGVETILKRLDASGARTRLVILDACRNNPFQQAEAGPRGLTVDGVAAGLPSQARDEDGLTRLAAGIGTLVAFSTAPGRVAADGRGDHSPYTEALLALIREPGLPIEALFRRARLAVHAATDGAQVPWESSSLTGAFSFFPADAGAPVAEADGLAPAARTLLAAGPTREGLRGLGPDAAHTLAIHLGTVEVFRLYVAAFPTDPRGLALYGLIDDLTQETAWVRSVRQRTRAALLAYRGLYPAGPHAAEVERLLQTVPEASPVLAVLCPAVPAAPPLPPVLPVRPEPPRRAERASGPTLAKASAPKPAAVKTPDAKAPSARALPAKTPLAKTPLAKAPPVPRPAVREPAPPAVVEAPPRRVLPPRPIPQREPPPRRRPALVEEADVTEAPAARFRRPPVAAREPRGREIAEEVDVDFVPGPRPVMPGLGFGRPGGFVPWRRPGGEGPRAPLGFGGPGGGRMSVGPGRMF